MQRDHEQAPPQLSPDGSWWWDGKQWEPSREAVPVADALTHTAVPAPIPAQPAPPVEPQSNPPVRTVPTWAVTVTSSELRPSPAASTGRRLLPWIHPSSAATGALAGAALTALLLNLLSGGAHSGTRTSAASAQRPVTTQPTAAAPAPELSAAPSNDPATQLTPSQTCNQLATPIHDTLTVINAVTSGYVNTPDSAVSEGHALGSSVLAMQTVLAQTSTSQPVGLDGQAMVQSALSLRALLLSGAAGIGPLGDSMKQYLDAAGKVTADCSAIGDPLATK